MQIAHEVVLSQRSRRSDRWGSGQFGAPRGRRTHAGIDIEAFAGEQVMSPIDGNVLREALPYPNDTTYRGVLIVGTGEWAGYEVKIFYVLGHFCGTVHAGDVIGTAQDLSRKYPGITNHIHLQVRRLGNILRPEELFQSCF